MSFRRERSGQYYRPIPPAGTIALPFIQRRPEAPHRKRGAIGVREVMASVVLAVGLLVAGIYLLFVAADFVGRFVGIPGWALMVTLVAGFIAWVLVSNEIDRSRRRRGSATEPRWISDYDDGPGRRYQANVNAMPSWTRSVPEDPPADWVTLAPLRIVRYEAGPGVPSVHVWQGEPDNWALATGTPLTLVSAYDPARDPKGAEADPATWYQWFADWETLEFRVTDGPRAGFKFTTCANPRGGRFPAAAQAAGALIAPANHPLATDAERRAELLHLLLGDERSATRTDSSAVDRPAEARA